VHRVGRVLNGRLDYIEKYNCLNLRHKTNTYERFWLTDESKQGLKYTLEKYTMKHNSGTCLSEKDQTVKNNFEDNPFFDRFPKNFNKSGPCRRGGS
jgi:hypothetical protein